MKFTDRWTKKQQYVEIEEAVSENGPIYIVATNVAWPLMPLEFKNSVPVTSLLAVSTFRNAVGDWAVQNGFTRSEA